MVERIGWTLVHFVWEGALIALVLALALLAVRHSAKARYALACAALIALAAAPVVTYRALAPVVIVVSGPMRWTPGEAILAGSSPFVQSAMPPLVGVWAFGVVALSVRLAGSLLQVERWRRRCTRPADAVWQARFEILSRGLGIRRRVSLLISDRLTVPSAWGVFRAVVVLPASLLSHLSPEQVETILLHELAHVRRHDYLVNLLQAVVETVLFYHPAVWWVSGVVRREREHCCDDVVVARLGDPIPYARALLHLEERRVGLPRPALSAKEGNLMNRIARILSPKPAPRRVSPLASTLAATAIAAALLGGALQAQAQSKTKPDPKPNPVSKTEPKKKLAVKKRPPVAVRRPLTRTIKTTIRTLPGTRVVTIQATTVAPTLAKLPKTPTPPPVASPQKRVETQIRLMTMPTKVDRGATGMPKPLQIRIVPPVPEAIAVDVAQGPKVNAPPASGGFGGGGAVGGFGGRGGFGGGGAVFGRGVADLGRPFDESDAVAVVFNPSNNWVSVDLKETALATVLRALARKSKTSIVIEAGNYGDVTMVLNDMPFESALQILCRAAKATYRHEDQVYYVSPSGK